MSAESWRDAGRLQGTGVRDGVYKQSVDQLVHEQMEGGKELPLVIAVVNRGEGVTLNVCRTVVVGRRVLPMLAAIVCRNPTDTFCKPFTAPRRSPVRRISMGLRGWLFKETILSYVSGAVVWRRSL